MDLDVSLLSNGTETLRVVAEEVARRLAYASTSGNDVYVQTPVAFLSGRSIGIRLLGGPIAFTVTDDGMTMREAEHLGADDLCKREARKVAGEFDLKFNEWELFEADVPADRLAGVVALLANAAAATMTRTSERFAERFDLRRREELSVRLGRVFGEARVTRDAPFVGAARTWLFDAHVYLPSGRSGLFSIVTPKPISVAVAYSKFDDVSRIDLPPFLGAVLEGRFEAGDKALLERAARRIYAASDPDEAFRSAA